MSIEVIKTNGEREEFSWDKIEAFYKRVAYGYNTKCPFSHLKENVENKLIDGIKTSDLTKQIEKGAIDLITPESPEWSNIAGRMKLRSLYKRASSYKGITNSELYTPEYFLELVEEYESRGLYHSCFKDKYTKEEILEAGKFLDQKIDDSYNFPTIQYYERRYLLNRDGIIRELPQHLYLSIALFLCQDETEDRLKKVEELYRATAEAKISLPTPTLLNARTPNCQLSSCFILDVPDDLRGIYHQVENMAQISKNGGGIGVYFGNVRSKGSPIKGVYGLSGGVNPWIKVVNDTGVAVNQMGKRAGAISVTLDIFHRDIYQFLDLQTETGDIRGKSFDVFPAVSFPDLFFKRLENNEEFTLFCPYEVETITGIRLQDLWGDEFDKAYIELEKDDRLQLKETVEAKDLFKTFLKATVETGMPYTFFRDTVNRLNPNKHAGVIHCSNLCTEIAQNQSAPTFKEEIRTDSGDVIIRYETGDTVICNLASINVAKVNTQEEMEKIFPIITRALDNVISLNAYPIEEAKISAEKYRAIGIGYMGVAEYLATNKINYGSSESVEVIDKLFKEYSYHTLKTSCDLAKERGAYPAFKGSDFSKGIAFGQNISDLFGGPYDKDFDYREGQELEDNIKAYGVRFGYHSAPAPNTSTAGVVGTTAGVVPIYKRFFVETNQLAPTVTVAPNLSTENFWYYKEYVKLPMDGVIDVVSTIQKYIDQSVSFEWLINPQTTSPADLYNYYLKAWKSGLKTIYYVRSLSLEVADSCESCSG